MVTHRKASPRRFDRCCRVSKICRMKKWKGCCSRSWERSEGNRRFIVNEDPKRSPLSPIKQAYLKLQEMQAQLNATEEARREPIAIVGMARPLPRGHTLPESIR